MRSTGTICFLMTLLTQDLRKVRDRGVKDGGDELRCDSDREHEQCYRQDSPSFDQAKIWRTAAAFRQRSTEKRLHRPHKNDGGDKQSKHRDCAVTGHECEGAFENQEFANKAVQPG